MKNGENWRMWDLKWRLNGWEEIVGGERFMSNDEGRFWWEGWKLKGNML